MDLSLIFTRFIQLENRGSKLNSKLFDEFHFRNKNVFDVINSQRIATENIFKKKNIPFRSFFIKKKNEETLGKLFCFFTLEVILLAHLLNINPLDQPEVELVKRETFKILKN